MSQSFPQPPYRGRTRIIDIDGTLLEKKPYQEAQAFPEAAEIVQSWFQQGDYIVIWTARQESLRDFTKKQLSQFNIPFHELLMNKPWSHEIHIYDDHAIVSYQIDRHKGIGHML